MAERQTDSPTHPSPARPHAAAGVLEAIGSVGSSLTVRREATVRELSTVTAESKELSRAVSHIDSRLSKLAARQRVLEARHTTLPSEARRSLRAAIWDALLADRLVLAEHDGKQRVAVAWLVSLTADDDHDWTAEIWAPVGEAADSATESALWEALVSASEAACEALHGRPETAASLVRGGIVGVRVRAPKGWSRDQLSSRLTAVLDRVRVQAVSLHQRRCEVSVVWLDLPPVPDDDSSFTAEDADTLVGAGTA